MKTLLSGTVFIEADPERIHDGETLKKRARERRGIRVIVCRQDVMLSLSLLPPLYAKFPARLDPTQTNHKGTYLVIRPFII